MIKKIIEKKLHKQELSENDIKYVIENYTNGKIDESYIGALLTAIYINDLNDDETYYLTKYMANSGTVLDLDKVDKNIVDKHSTGGVGDKVTLALLPLVASCGITICKMSGKSLGFTGGTVDKFASIPNFQLDLDEKTLKKNLATYGAAISSQTNSLVPADKKLYALRDKLGLIDNNSLIASSVMSKKIASGAKNIVLEVTTGSGSFAKTLDNAKDLANKMINIGKKNNLNVVAVITNMEQNLGYSIGNTLELVETIEFLKRDKKVQDLEEIVLLLSSYMICMYYNYELNDTNLEVARKIALENLENKMGYEMLKTLTKAQGGDVLYISNPDKFESAKFKKDIYAKSKGYVSSFKTDKIGYLSHSLGEGNNAGIYIYKKVGDEISQNELIATIYSNDEYLVDFASKEFEKLFEISDKQCEKLPVILEVLK